MSSFLEPINIEDEQQVSDNNDNHNDNHNKNDNDNEDLDEDQIDDYKDMIQQLGTFPVSTKLRNHNLSSMLQQ